jgi:hypothetical protein
MQCISLHNVKSVELKPTITSTITITGEFFHRDIVVKHADGIMVITLFAESSSDQLQVTEATTPEALL